LSRRFSPRRFSSVAALLSSATWMPFDLKLA
jgi:hypothetical protein